MVLCLCFHLRLDDSKGTSPNGVLQVGFEPTPPTQQVRVLFLVSYWRIYNVANSPVFVQFRELITRSEQSFDNVFAGKKIPYYGIPSLVWALGDVSIYVSLRDFTEPPGLYARIEPCPNQKPNTKNNGGKMNRE